MIEIRRLNPGWERNLYEFFEKIKEDVNFHPHPFTAEYANFICNYSGRDVYVMAAEKESILCYGMLRGWDDGFEVPSLGIVVSPEYRGRGIGKMMMTHLHEEASMRGAKKIRLKVYPNNQRAISLYKSLGYVFEDVLEQDQYVGNLTLG